MRCPTGSFVCRAPGCENPPKSRAVCNAHYLKWRRGESEIPVSHLLHEISDEEAFLERSVLLVDGCWAWIGATSATGLRTFPVEGKRIDALRASLRLFGEIPYGHVVLPCDSRAECVNPAHLSTRPVSRTDDQIFEAMTADKIREFWSMVSIGEADKCWEWRGSRFPSGGYGRFRVWSGDEFDGRRRSHRISLCLATGLEYDTPLDVLHSCDNPPCVNPKHLRWGSAEENLGDARGRRRLGRAA